jgi:alpha-ketoglutarate-dependent taurine dioxygenase
MATATALARARPAKTTCNPTPTSQIIGPEGPKHPGNRQLYDKRGCPDAGAPLCGNHADTKVATFCAALWLTFTLPLTIVRFAEKLGLDLSEEHRSAEDNGIVVLRTTSEQGKQGYIPYTAKPMNWHTDGYYNPSGRPIQSFILHCHEQAETGGENQLVDPEMAYLAMREANPAFVEALMQRDSMTIPENREGDGTIRPASVGPVFFPHPATGRLQMRYTARTRSIAWKDDGITKEAADWLRGWLTSDAAMAVSVRFRAGDGVVNNNVLHNRTGFESVSARAVLRVRFHERVSEI